MQHSRNILLAAIAAVLLIPITAWAKPQVNISIKAEKEVIVIEGNEQIVKRLPAAEAAPGETVIFTIQYENSGDETATNVVINNPIPEGTAYMPGSATETGEVTFSIDGGESYKKPSMLSYEVTTADDSKEKRVATPEQYTHIRWLIPAIPTGGPGEVSFRVQLQ